MQTPRAVNINQRCDCYVQRDRATGVLRGYTKCRLHVKELIKAELDQQAHYKSLGALDHPDVYIREFEDCFGPLPSNPGSVALEIGAGTSPYIPMLLASNYSYGCVEPSPFAANWLRNQAGVGAVFDADWERLEAPAPVDLILAAHCIEHMQNAPQAVQKMADALRPGGRLFVIVPDDQDLCNPDHWWFFTEATLRRTVEAAGLQVEVMTSRRRVAHEKFIYCAASKL